MIKIFHFSLLICFITFVVHSTATTPTYDVIIIGAGASGISATSKLLKYNISNVLVLEAEDRIGGRIHSVKFGEVLIDLGAEWVQGHENNVAYDLVKQYDLIEYKNYSNIKILYSNKINFPDDLIEHFMQIEEEIYSSIQVDHEISMGNYITKEFQKKVANLSIPAEFPHLLEDMLQHFKHVVLGWEGAFDWNELSAVSDSEDSSTVNLYTWNGKGYKTILDIILQKFPEMGNPLAADKMLLNTQVTTIYWDNADDTVTIKCRDNAEYVARKVIFTPSIGVLKLKMNDLFQPPLPLYKKRAIETLGIEAVAKVSLEFSNNWWNSNGQFDVINLIWEKEHRESLTNFTVNGRIWITDMAAIVSADQNPKVLTIWFVGPSIPSIEAMDEQELIDGIQFAFHQFLGVKYQILRPKSILRSQWYSNPHFHGAYSFQTVESRKKPTNIDLSKPLQNSRGNEVLLFAGEATNNKHFGTVHGAIETGWREADRIIGH